MDADNIKIVVDQFFPDGAINKWMSEMSDSRKPGMITYELSHLLWAGLLMFILRLKSRRQLKKVRETDVFLANLFC